jgi:hypothetical protein
VRQLETQLALDQHPIPVTAFQAVTNTFNLKLLVLDRHPTRVTAIQTVVDFS